MIVRRDDNERHLFDSRDVHALVKRAGLHAAFADARQADKVFLTAESFRHQRAHGHRNHRAEVTNHGQLIVARPAPVNIAVSSTHRALSRAEKSARSRDAIASTRDACATLMRGGKTALSLRTFERELALRSGLAVSVRWRSFGGNLPWSGQFHANELAHAALLHRDTVKHIRFCNRAFVVGHDDELALLYETVQHADKAVDVAFIKRRIYFAENAEPTRSPHE